MAVLNADALGATDRVMVVGAGWVETECHVRVGGGDCEEKSPVVLLTVIGDGGGVGDGDGWWR